LSELSLLDAPDDSCNGPTLALQRYTSIFPGVERVSIIQGGISLLGKTFLSLFVHLIWSLALSDANWLAKSKQGPRKAFLIILISRFGLEPP